MRHVTDAEARRLLPGTAPNREDAPLGLPSAAAATAGRGEWTPAHRHHYSGLTGSTSGCRAAHGGGFTP
jgi:hypothetical protein